jgi:hypothetical protein
VLTHGGDEFVTVQYQWQVGDNPPCCPTGIGTVRFQIGDDGNQSSPSAMCSGCSISA